MVQRSAVRTGELGFGAGQTHAKSGILAKRAFDFKVAPMAGHYVLYDGKAQPGTAHAP
jgi:hypothetical protein